MNLLNHYLPMNHEKTLHFRHFRSLTSDVVTAFVGLHSFTKNDMFLSLAITANADCLITRDEDLLVLHPFENIPILNTADFMRRFFPY
jgi:predicted nucleic acid-binding protein